MRFACTLLASATIVLTATPDFAAAQSVAFDVPREPVSRAIRRISQQAGVEIIVAGDVARGRTGNAITGTMDVEEALSRLVAGTGLEARKTGERRFALVLAEDDPIRGRSGRNAGTHRHGGETQPADRRRAAGGVGAWRQ